MFKSINTTLVQSTELQTLRKEIREMREQTKCKICLSHQVEVLFLPCGHLACCTKCASSQDSCPICRQSIKGVVRTHLN